MVGEERLPVRGDREPLRRRVARDELRRARDSGCDRARRADDRHGASAARRSRRAARRIRSGAVSAPDPDVERFLLTLQARRSPRTVDAYRRDLKPFAAFREEDRRGHAVEELESWLAGMRADGLASSTIARRVSAVRAYFRHLVLIGVETRTPLPRFSYRAEPARYLARSRRPRRSG